VLKRVNEVLSPNNVEKQYSDSKGDVAYVMADIADVSPQDIIRLREMIDDQQDEREYTDTPPSLTMYSRYLQCCCILFLGIVLVDQNKRN
jgi:hypothetical protein